MKTAIFSDIHGNLPALELMLSDAGPVENWICLGDIVNYGPWSNECVDIITSMENCTIISGNHEDYFNSGHYESVNVSKQFFDFCFPRFNRFEKIKSLPAAIVRHGFTFIHTIDNKNIYPDTNITLDNNYFIGHSHHQFKTENNGFTLYNAGSVGQNRKYINVVNYLVLDSNTGDVEMRGFKYDESVVINEMRKAGYPPECIDYYDSKARLL